jgi:hypothetical protein
MMGNGLQFVFIIDMFVIVDQPGSKRSNSQFGLVKKARFAPPS